MARVADRPALLRRALEFGHFQEEPYPISMFNPRDSQVGKQRYPNGSLILKQASIAPMFRWFRSYSSRGVD